MKLARMLALFTLALVAVALLMPPAARADDPRLLNGGVSSTSSDDSAVYVFMVTYQGNASAQSVRVMINGNSHDMQEFDAADSNFSDGKAYFYSTRLKGGMNTYSFACSDADGGTNATAPKMILVKETPLLQLTHLDVMFSVFIFVPFVIYFVYLARKMQRSLERMERREKEERKGEGQ
ncbi:MAG: hypothetical protein HZB92_08140 [Euryarchaeota archaeon]|nr:hypothetical protein [Euryarchaeota archaeon]